MATFYNVSRVKTMVTFILNQLMVKGNIHKRIPYMYSIYVSIYDLYLRLISLRTQNECLLNLATHKLEPQLFLLELHFFATELPS